MRKLNLGKLIETRAESRKLEQCLILIKRALFTEKRILKISIAPIQTFS